MKQVLFSLFILLPFYSKAQFPNTISPEDKVYGLSKFWQEVNYNFVYINRVDRKKWDSAYMALIGQVQKTPNDYEYYRLLSKFCAMLKDGHTNIFPPRFKYGRYMQNTFGEYLVVLKRIENKIVIVRTWKKDLDLFPIGSEIGEVNDIPVEKFREDSVAAYFSSSTEYVLKNMSSHYLIGGIEGQSFKIAFRTPAGKTNSITLTHEKVKDSVFFPSLNKYYDELTRPLFDYKLYPNNIAYIGLSSFGDEKIDSLFIDKLPELYKAQGLIIDLRFNGGGSTDIGTKILQYLTNDTLMQHSVWSTRLHLPAFKAWGAFVEAKDTAGNAWNKKAFEINHDDYWYKDEYTPDTFHLNAKRLVVPTVILIGNNTASAAEDFLISASNQKHMIKMGEPTFGSTGQPYFFDLPGGGSARICTKKDTYPDGREFVGYGIQPDISVPVTLKSYFEYKDIVLDSALAYLNKKLKK